MKITGQPDSGRSSVCGPERCNGRIGALKEPMGRESKMILEGDVNGLKFELHEVKYWSSDPERPFRDYEFVMFTEYMKEGQMKKNFRVKLPRYLEAVNEALRQATAKVLSESPSATTIGE